MIRPYHFTKDIGNGFYKFYKKVIDFNGIICFDFEDSINAKEDIDIVHFKNTHRDTLVNQLNNVDFEIDFNRIGFRINGIDTKNYFSDIECIDKFDNINSVFFPKVESYVQIERLLKDIPSCVNEIIPIIETKKGFENIEEILSINDNRYLRIAFGHCDYNLSQNYFPFYHQSTKKYWEWISTLVYHSSLAEKELINSPILNLDDDEIFLQNLYNIRLYNNITGQITLCLKQTILCNDMENNNCKLFEFGQRDFFNCSEIANEIINKFEKNILEDRFFALDERRVIISPQEYKSAKRLLKEI